MLMSSTHTSRLTLRHQSHVSYEPYFMLLSWCFTSDDLTISLYYRNKKNPLTCHDEWIIRTHADGATQLVDHPVTLFYQNRFRSGGKLRDIAPL